MANAAHLTFVFDKLSRAHTQAFSFIIIFIIIIIIGVVIKLSRIDEKLDRH